MRGLMTFLGIFFMTFLQEDDITQSQGLDLPEIHGIACETSDMIDVPGYVSIPGA
jgi:hypothetical protein